LWVELLFEHDVHVEVARDLLVDRLQELVELDRAMAVVQRADHLAVARSSAA
jgi:hypothetical protein